VQSGKMKETFEQLLPLFWMTGAGQAVSHIGWISNLLHGPVKLE